MSKRDWKPIVASSVKVAEALGHELSEFLHRDQNAYLKRAECNRCEGGCWVAYAPTIGFTAGGSTLKFSCEELNDPPRE